MGGYLKSELDQRIAELNCEGRGLVEYGGDPIRFEGGDSFSSNSPSETLPFVGAVNTSAVNSNKDVRTVLVHGLEGGSVATGYGCKCGRCTRSVLGLRKHAKATHSVREFK